MAPSFARLPDATPDNLGGATVAILGVAEASPYTLGVLAIQPMRRRRFGTPPMASRVNCGRWISTSGALCSAPTAKILAWSTVATFRRTHPTPRATGPGSRRRSGIFSRRALCLLYWGATIPCRSLFSKRTRDEVLLRCCRSTPMLTGAISFRATPWVRQSHASGLRNALD